MRRRASDAARAGPGERRLDRLVAAQVHVTVLAVAAGPIMLLAAFRLTRVPGGTDLWAGVLAFTGVGTVAAGLAPWISDRVTVRLQRLLLWSVIAIATVGIVGAIWTVELWALLGLQMLIAAAALAEIGTQRRALLHYWIGEGFVAGSVWLYHILVAVGPRI